MNQIELIKTKIKQQYDLNYAKATEWESKEDRHNYGVWYEGKVEMCRELLSILDAIEEQPVCEDLEEEIREFVEQEWDGLHDNDGNPLYTADYLEYIARHFYELGRQSKPKVSDEFEEEFIRYIHEKDAEVSEQGESTYAQEDLEDIASHFAQWGAEHRGSSETTKDLEEAAEISFDEAKSLTEGYMYFLAKGLKENHPRPIGPHWFCEYAKNRFIAGAKWQKEKDESIYRKFFNDRNQGDASFYDLLAYREGHRDGMDEQKEQMMNEAVEGIAHPVDCEIWVNLVGYGYKFKEGDNVKIIIIN